MKKFFTTVLVAAALLPMGSMPAMADKSLRVFDGVTFYDGYNSTIVDAGLNDGILRHQNSLYAVKLTDEQLNSFGKETKMKVTIGALCDNYDRRGSIYLTLVPKGRSSYKTDDKDIQRYELGRFITPFMDKNSTPNEVLYLYQVDYIGMVMRNATLRRLYDYWMEFEVFGIPYDAQEKVDGCKGRSDVFTGTLDFVTSEPVLPGNNSTVLKPIVVQKPEYVGGGNLNNYSETATDTIGKTTKTYTFTLPSAVADGQLVVITSNHGANANGEEYNRRWHFIYMDDQLIAAYKPGRTTCEPFRIYNTQANGIYGLGSKTAAEWMSFSNWCPGDKIDNREIRLGRVNSGTHKVRISVPNAVFADKQGDIPVSMYFIGVSNGELPLNAGVEEASTDSPVVNLTYATDTVQIKSTHNVESVELHNMSGQCLYRSAGPSEEVSLRDYPSGVYLLSLYLDNGTVATHKVVKP